jgi:mono/diheme cytochrome c family protein
MISKRLLLSGLPLIAGAVFLTARAAVGGAFLSANLEVTFTRDVAPILFKHCAECHRPNDAAPFSLLTYKDARPWARSIREKVITREMPPWHADQRYGDFRNDARLSQKEIDTIVTWVDQGAPEGNLKHLPPVPEYIDGWRIGTPDQIFSMAEEHTIEPGAPDDYFVFTIPTRFKEDKWIQAAEIRPSNRRIVHHAIAHIFTPESIARSSRGNDRSAAKTRAAKIEDEPPIFYRQGSLSRVKMDAPVIDDGARAINGGSLFKRSASNQGSDLFSILLTSYAPGKGPDVYDRGMAKKIPAGSIIVLQVHYSGFRGSLDKPVKDRTSVGLIFASEPPANRVVTLTVPNHFFKIPPGADNHEVTSAYTFEEDVQLISYMPHMHLRGKDMKYEALYPDTRRETLLWVSNFNFNWQATYYLKTPIPIPKGTKAIITAHFDNSAKNNYNPDPNKAVRWGDPTYDEMMIGWIEYVVPNSK